LRGVVGGDVACQRCDALLRTEALERKINTVDTSSYGRLFDAVRAIRGSVPGDELQGKAAIELEMIAETRVEECYPFEIVSGEIDTRPIIRAVVADVLRGQCLGQVPER
jgi:hydrogenase maturation protein HypF